MKNWLKEAHQKILRNGTDVRIMEVKQYNMIITDLDYSFRRSSIFLQSKVYNGKREES